MIYDELNIICKLDRLDPTRKVAFAAACAERQLPGYVAFSKTTGRGDPDALRAILERVWRDVMGERMADEELAVVLDRCTSLIPQEDEGPWVTEQAYAEDAASAVVYALRARKAGESQEAAYAARVAYEALDHHVINRLGIEVDAEVLAHPIVQEELARQQRDLDELHTFGGDPAEVIARLRDRARAEAAIFFDHGS